MSGRKLGYLIGVSLLAFLFSAPQLLLTLSVCLHAYQSKTVSVIFTDILQIPGMGKTVYPSNELADAPFWRNQFVVASIGKWGWRGIENWNVRGIDPETGNETDLHLSVDEHSLNLHPLVAGNRLWLLGQFKSFEVVNGVPVPFRMPIDAIFSQPRPRFLWNGVPADVYQAGAGFRLATYSDGTWKDIAMVVLPDPGQNRSLNGIPIDIGRVYVGTCRQHGDHLYLFASDQKNFLFHEGLELKPIPKASIYSMTSAAADVAISDEPVSALKASNTDADLDGWSVISPGTTMFRAYGEPVPERLGFGMIVEGQPAALVVRGVSSEHAVGSVYRFDGTQWTIVATQTFPFGCSQFPTVTTDDGQRSYIIATTSMGVAHVYAVEASGIRKTNGAANTSNPGLRHLRSIACVPLAFLGLGTPLALCLWFLMWCTTKPEYAFGKQTIKLSSLGWRGLARLIDMAVIVALMIGMGWVMTLGFDWSTFLEALNLHIDHPTIPVARRVAWMLAAWLALLVATMLITQANWGVTPGKWICRLRTVRTSLRPCGFTACLARELVFLFDCCGFICWTPGILCIAVTDWRQRLGDIVADTIVVDARTLS